MRCRRWKRVLAWAAAAFLFGVAVLWFVYRPWARNWGATAQEITQAMVGDDIIADATFAATRGVTIEASPAGIWPWLVQMGYGRAGFYSYDRLDNDGVPSAEHILARFQNLAVGDWIPLTRHDSIAVTVLVPDNTMLWEYRGDHASTVFTWAWRLYPLSASRTRLVTRLRYRAQNLRSQLALDFFEILMMRKCMLGIRRRAEDHPPD